MFFSVAKRSKRSIVWNYFKKISNEKFAVCQISNCGAEVSCSGNTSNCMHHLQRHHGPFLRAVESGTISNTSSSSSEELCNNKKSEESTVQCGEK